MHKVGRFGAATATAYAVLALALGGCGEDSKREEKPIPVEDSVFGDQVEQIDRAKQRASEMEGRMQDLNSQLEQAEGAPDREEDGEDDSSN